MYILRTDKGQYKIDSNLFCIFHEKSFSFDKEDILKNANLADEILDDEDWSDDEDENNQKYSDANKEMLSIQNLKKNLKHFKIEWIEDY